MPHLVLYQPDIPQNTGTLLRLSACLGRTVHLIEPAGFPLSDKGLKRAGMDYLDQAALVRHMSHAHFEAWRLSEGRRLVLLTTRSDLPYTDFTFRTDDLLMLGRESSGVPEAVHDGADARITVPMRPETRSLNVAIAGAMVLGEALRQTSAFPG
ncbi:tRNA (cytidine(34)-2'-O)-methyltransferase [Roseibium aestuarii]|uniref:tRNA (cytidine(34)-2'-O)-methyltransferase n=1 Tax=Roseibium aestuarii TaxID=2600299 RepID=A0ABW4JXA6_9HYPH|nr:tRNA (cytidine(34)-2'-O)-methyltransferase [Roseibium aestuarii]